MNHYLLGLSLVCLNILMSACQPQAINAVAQQQHQVCKSLIDGFLNIHQLGNYELDSIQPNLELNAQSRRYIFRTSSDNQIRINMPKQQNIEFICQQKQARNFELQLWDKQKNEAKSILSLQLPPQKLVDNLKAYSMNNQ